MFLEQQEYDKALELAWKIRKRLRRHDYVSVGLGYLDQLVAAEQWAEAAALCGRMDSCGKMDAALWVKQITRFEELGLLRDRPVSDV